MQAITRATIRIASDFVMSLLSVDYCGPDDNGHDYYGDDQSEQDFDQASVKGAFAAVHRTLHSGNRSRNVSASRSSSNAAERVVQPKAQPEASEQKSI